MGDNLEGLCKAAPLWAPDRLLPDLNVSGQGACELCLNDIRTLPEPKRRIVRSVCDRRHIHPQAGLPVELFFDCSPAEGLQHLPDLLDLSHSVKVPAVRIQQDLDPAKRLLRYTYCTLPIGAASGAVVHNGGSDLDVVGVACSSGSGPVVDVSIGPLAMVDGQQYPVVSVPTIPRSAATILSCLRFAKYRSLRKAV